MSRDGLPAAVAADEYIGPPFLPAQFFTIADAFDRTSTGDNRCVANDLHFIVILSKCSKFHLVRFPSCKAFSSRRQTSVRVRGHELRRQNALKCGCVILHVLHLRRDQRLQRSAPSISWWCPFSSIQVQTDYLWADQHISGDPANPATNAGQNLRGALNRSRVRTAGIRPSAS